MVAEVERYTSPVATTAREALQDELDRTAGAIRYLQRTLDRFEGDPPPAWLSVYAAERQHLARLVDRMAAQEDTAAGAVATARERLAEQLETALVGILTDLGHDPDDTVTRAVVAHHLRRVSGTAPAAPAPLPEPQPITAAPPPPVAF